MKINDKIKYYREKLGISQRELGRRIDKSGQYISYLEKNSEINPSMEVISKIADSLEIPVLVLLDNSLKVDGFGLGKYDAPSQNEIPNYEYTLDAIIGDIRGLDLKSLFKIQKEITKLLEMKMLENEEENN